MCWRWVTTCGSRRLHRRCASRWIIWKKLWHFFLQHNPFAPIQKIGMTGLSLGAVYTLLCALYLPEIFCVAAVFGFDFVMNGCKNALLG